MLFFIIDSVSQYIKAEVFTSYLCGKNQSPGLAGVVLVFIADKRRKLINFMTIIIIIISGLLEVNIITKLFIVRKTI